MRVGLGISIAVGAGAKLAVEFRFCGLKSSNQCWDIIRAPSEQSPESTGIWTSPWPSREVQEREAGGRWCSSSSSVEPTSLKSSLCWWLVHAVQPPVPSTVFLLIRKVAFKTAFCLGLQCYRTSFTLAALSLEMGFWGACKYPPKGLLCEAAQLAQLQQKEVPALAHDRTATKLLGPAHVLPQFLYLAWRLLSFAVHCLSSTLFTVRLVECTVTYLCTFCILTYCPEISLNTELYFACAA